MASSPLSVSSPMARQVPPASSVTEAARGDPCMTLATELKLKKRGDPRMNLAVKIKLKKPNISLSKAITLGGFQYPPKAVAATLDDENVTLGQRKNQLNRRLRQARIDSSIEETKKLQHNKREAISRGNSAASSSSSASAQSLPLQEGLLSSRPTSAASNGSRSTHRQSQKRPAKQDNQPNRGGPSCQGTAFHPIRASEVPQYQDSGNLNKQQHQHAFTNGSLVVAAASNTAAPMKFLSKCSNNLQRHPYSMAIDNPCNVDSSSDTSSYSSSDLISILCQAQRTAEDTHDDVQQQLLQGLDINNDTSQLFAQQQRIEYSSGSTAHCHPDVNGNFSQKLQHQPQQRPAEHNGTQEQFAKINLGLQFFENEIHSIYAPSMLQAGFAPEEIEQSSSAYHQFAFLAAQRECTRLKDIMQRYNNHVRINCDDGNEPTPQY